MHVSLKDSTWTTKTALEILRVESLYTVVPGTDLPTTPILLGHHSTGEESGTAASAFGASKSSLKFSNSS